MTKQVYINLPVEDLDRSRKFWESLGYTFEDHFSDSEAACLVLSPGHIYSMLLTRRKFAEFTDRPIAEAGKTTQVLIAIDVDEKSKVDELVRLAVENGGSIYSEPKDHDWMYYHSFADPDGHQWEVLYMDESRIPAVNETVSGD